MSFQDFNTSVQTAINENSILNASNDHLSEVPAVTPPAKLKAKPKRLTGIWALPFSADNPRKSATPYWIIPAIGGYEGGYEIGALMAHSYLKFLRDDPNNGCISYLSDIVESIESRIKGVYKEDLKLYEQSNECSSLRGQEVGFFNTLDQWLSFAAKNAGGRLDELTNKDVIKQTNKYLQSTDELCQ